MGPNADARLVTVEIEERLETEAVISVETRVEEGECV